MDLVPADCRGWIDEEAKAPMADVKRICGNCGSNRTLVGEGIYEVRDLRGNPFAVVGSCCFRAISDMVDALAVKYGAYVKDGVKMCSPIGSPSIRSIEHLREEIGQVRSRLESL